ncbi:MAG: hypothetical protein HGB12_05115, partial [Bacteroidetes bacterium]|nr:hypothetical protein [Bacteroidota bacterium]
SGNAGTDTTTNFIGTTDDRSWVMKTNNTERMKISKSGNVGIGTSNPSSSAILDVSSTTKGMRMPNMTTDQRNLISSPATGLQIYNTDCGSVDFYNGTCWISMSKALPNPKDITSSPASTYFCEGESRTYSISPVTGANYYTWTVPSGATINSGQGTTSITATFSSISGNVCVNASNACETSGQSCLAVTMKPLADTPGGITGLNSVYPYQQTVTYSISGSGSYTWSVPSGVTITSGQGTNTIIVNFACNAVSGNISVAASNTCGLGGASTLAVTVTSLIASAGPTVVNGAAIGGSPTASAGTSPYTYLWSPATNLSSATVSNPTAQCGTPASYTVTVTDNKGCTATSSVAVSRVTANAGSNMTSTGSPCTSSTVIGPATVSGGLAPYSYLWSPSVTLSSATVTNPTASAGSTTTYVVTVTDANTCTASSSMILTVGSTAFYTTPGYTSWTVPTGISCILIEAYGAGGTGGSGIPGKGCRVKTVLSVSGGQVLNINVGGTGGGYNGGGATASCGGGGGGGGTDIRFGGTALANRIIVAGGGGGSGNAAGSPGGDGGNGGTLGYSGNTNNGGGCGSGSGGTATAGGTGGSSGGSGYGGAGTGGNCSNGGGGGGGGGGYWGGGGSPQGCGNNGGGGGGGGSSYVTTTNTSNTTYTDGYQSGNGKVIITW